ncbi:MAG: type II toxin-antitoxin system ParD family antitoxin [bacterium]|mgnify:CR=1 FL=1|jgi:antitoxin ParD1/3/4|nr:type II toxin-antitoxin system ParD family antitoxin [bacterium]MBK7672638.1 type II toxin-antitoxin system ParD family antitoxin [bacterium]MBK9778003.1 type II toxin-antitoxin system ParD family antitoxin [bacterium]
MNVSVGKEFEEFAKRKVASGDYASVSEVVRDGLRLLREKDLILEARLQALRGDIQKGIDQADAGQLLDGPQVMAELRELIKRRKP